MGFSPTFLNTLKNSVDIVQVVRAHVKLQQRGHNHVGLCPFHQEKTPSFHVFGAQGTYHCFGCQAHGDAINFIREHLGLSFTDAVEYLAKMHGIPIVYQAQQDSDKQKELRQRDERLRKALECALKHFHSNLIGNESPAFPLVERARTWLHERALSRDAADQFQLGVADTSDARLRQALHAQGIVEQDWLDSGLYYKKDDGRLVARFRGRLMFPIHDKRAQLVGFGGRRLDDSLDIAKYVNSPQTELFHKKTLLYGFHHANMAIRKSKEAYVVEGYTDVIALHQHGIHNAVAPLGTALNVDHIKTLWQSGAGKPTLFFDGDAAGIQTARKVAHAMLPVITSETSLQFIPLPDNEDPQSLLQKDASVFDTILKKTYSLAEVLWQEAVERYLPMLAKGQKPQPEERAQFQTYIRRLPDAIEDKILQKELKNDFYERVGALLYTKKEQKKLSSATQNVFAHHRRTQPNQTRLRKMYERILAYCLYHPQLLSLYSEELSRVEVSVAVFDTCIQKMIESPDSTHSDTAQLRAWLAQQDCQKALALLEEPKLRRECNDNVSFTEAEQAFKDLLDEETRDRLPTKDKLKKTESIVRSLDSRLDSR
ncbi:MAG: DNA primase [Alphaproteobacteria bacterium GM202ARS2]|nr:DNA primase [Alphaproteobacteria bacterium GM202ARS2]